MADEIKTVEEAVADLSKPENKADLAKTLDEAFKQGTQPAETETADAPEAENKSGAEVVIPKEGAAPKAGEEVDRKTRVQELLADRNEAAGAAAGAQTEAQILTKRVEELTALVTKLTSGKDGAGAEPDENLGDAADDKPMTKKELDAYLAKKEQDKNATAEQTAAAEKSITDQIQALDTNKETPNAKEYAEEIAMTMRKFKGMSAIGAYGFLKGNGIIPSGAVARSNANRTGTGNRSKTTLLDNKNPDDMTQAEKLAYLKGAEKSGDLKL